MKQDEAESLAREFRAPDSWDGVTHIPVARLRALCDHILSGDHKREIENAAFERARDIAEEVRRANVDTPPKQNGWVAAFTIAEQIGSLIQPPAQKENGE